MLLLTETRYVQAERGSGNELRSTVTRPLERNTTCSEATNTGVIIPVAAINIRSFCVGLTAELAEVYSNLLGFWSKIRPSASGASVTYVVAYNLTKAYAVHVGNNRPRFLSEPALQSGLR